MQKEIHSFNSTVGSLPYWEVKVDAFQSVRETLALLDNNVHVPGVMVFENSALVGLIPRERVYEKLGRPYGVELFLKLNNRQFYDLLRTTTLVLTAETLIDAAVKLALARNGQSLFDPIVIKLVKGFGVISMYRLLMAQQDYLQVLYYEVRNLSIIDPLTLVNNRRGFFEIINRQMETIRRFDFEYAFLMIDIDNFKSVNDRFGHIVGDEVIKGVAHQIGEQIRKQDIVGRFGGEEFVVFFVDVSKDEVLALAERLRQEIARSFQTISGYQIRVTVSVGISHSKGARSTIDRLLLEADQAVYAAKNMGRNKVVMWEEGLRLAPLERNIFRRSYPEGLAQSEQLLEQILQGLLRMLYLRDFETEAHTLRVARMALNLAKKTGIAEEHFDGIWIGALLHDIGKIAIPDSILFKSGELSQAEWAVMRKHPEYARELLAPMAYFKQAIDIPYCHHEYWNGSGYPRGLRGEEIPLAARIFTVVDVWDALLSDRPYRAAWTEAAVKNYLAEQAGLLFDPELVRLFLDYVETPTRVLMESQVEA